jgi:hypothetical protein
VRHTSLKEEENIILLEGSQAVLARPSDKDNMGEDFGVVSIKSLREKMWNFYFVVMNDGIIIWKAK